MYFAKQQEHSIIENDVDIVSFKDEYQQDSSYTSGDSLSSMSKANELQDFPFSQDTSVLPIAPYKNIQDKLDFRATMDIYLECIKDFVAKSSSGLSLQPPVFSFNWKDFVDLNILKPLLVEKPNCFRIGALGATSRVPWPNCLDEPKNLGFVFITPSLEPEPELRLSIRGKSYLYTAAPIPKKIVFLAGELAFVTKVNKKAGLLESKMIDDYVRRKHEAHPNLRLEQIIKSPINPVHEINEITKILKRDLINFDTEKSLEVNVDSNSFRSPGAKQKSDEANSARHFDDRHFRNVLVKSRDGKWVSEEYYDWRFFNKKLNNLNKRKALHAVVENYLQLCTNIGISTWLSSESLVSAQYNGLIGPWEDTVKFELPATDLKRLANSFNYTLIVSDPRNDTGSYLVDISPWYLERARHNDGGAAPDVADGKIIDTKTGVYIELNGVIQAPEIPENLLAKTDDKDLSKYVTTGKGNFWYLPDLLPLKKTLYEGKLANIPKVIPKEFSTPPSGYVFREHLRLFANETKCSYVPEEEKDKFDLSYIGCCHDNLIWKEYNSTKFATLRFMEVNGYPMNVLDEVDINFN